MEGLREEVRRQARDERGHEEPEANGESEADLQVVDPEIVEQSEAQIAELDGILSRIVRERELSSEAAIELRQTLDALGPEDHVEQMQRIAQLANSGAFRLAPNLKHPF